MKEWRQDALAGLVVSFVSLPLSSGIAIASGAPPVYGIISSIIAGLVFPFVGGSFVTISGPAAGLAPALLATMVALGGAGSADEVGAGYPMLLAVICSVGVAQIVVARLGLARFAAIFPASVVEGMLGAIGVLILVKAIPLALGFLEPIHAHGFAEYLAEIPRWVEGANLESVWIAGTCLAVFGVLGTRWARRVALFRTVPAHVFAVAAGIALAAGFGLSSEYLIFVPSNPLSGIQAPALGELFASPELWQAALIGFVTLALIDGVESLATAQAIDRIDPFERKSSPNQLLRAMGISNVVSSLVGGLTIIPGGVKSKTCIEAGGRTLWANFFNACFLLCFLFVAPDLVRLMPKAALGAVLVYTGWKMAHPRIAIALNEIGREQCVFYGMTVVITLLSDLLVGVLAGTAIKYVFVLYRAGSPSEGTSLGCRLAEPFRDPVTRVVETEGRRVLEVERPLVCFNAYRLLERLGAEEAAAHPTVVRILEDTRLIDHTAAEGVATAVRSALQGDVEVEGLSRLQPVTSHPHALRVAHPVAAVR